MIGLTIVLGKLRCAKLCTLAVVAVAVLLFGQTDDVNHSAAVAFGMRFFFNDSKIGFVYKLGECIGDCV